MHIVEEDLATVDKADAYQADDLLIVRVAGQKPTACHIVSVERALTDVEPPAFVARLAMDPRARCMDVVADYEVVQAFRIGTARDEIVVHHAGGALTVQVSDLTVDGVAGVQGIAGGGQAGHLPLDIPGEPAEAYGFSRDYDLGEAVKDAISKLPARGAGIPDWLSTYTVVSIGAEIGGIGGFNHLKVTVRG